MYRFDSLRLLASNLALKTAEGATSAAVAQAESGQPTLEEVKSNVRDVKILLANDTLTAYVVFDMYGKDLSLTLEGGLRVVDGYLRLAPTAGALGSMPIPQGTLDNAVQRLFDSPENKEKFRLPPHIRDDKPAATMTALLIIRRTRSRRWQRQTS